MHYIYDTQTGNVLGSVSDRSMIENDLKANHAFITPTQPVSGPLKRMRVVNGVLTVNLEETQAEDVRAQRDALIAETDWWATSDRTMTAAEITYRQDLRDITAQAGFPSNVNWPTKP